MSYYTAITIITWVSLGVLCILVLENDRIQGRDEHVYYLTYSLIALAALAEWTGVMLSGNPDVSPIAIRMVKCFDYMLTPMAAGSLVAQMRMRNKGYRLLMGILAANCVFQIISLFTGWTVTVNKDNTYTHGRYYNVYIMLCLAAIALVIYEFVIYGRQYRRQNTVSLYAIVGVVLVGMWAQELYTDVRTEYIAMTIAASMLFIHFTEYSQIKRDDEIEIKNRLINTDPLTGILSRTAYSHAVEEYMAKGALPDDLAVFEIDINGLKECNDTLGHEAGDELICGAADTISQVFEGHGDCYRTGGDEFVVFAKARPIEADFLLDELKKAASKWCGKKAKELSLAAGYAVASEFRGADIEELVRLADEYMYGDKATYYTTSGRDRRRRHRMREE